MQTKGKYLIIALAIIIVLTLVFYFWPGLKRTYSYFRAVYTLSDNEAILILDFNGQKAEGQRWFKGEVAEGMTLLNILQAAGLAGDFNINANSQIASIDDVVSNANKQWVCYLNNQQIQEKLSDIKISPKDKILCKYR